MQGAERVVSLAVIQVISGGGTPLLALRMRESPSRNRDHNAADVALTYL